MLSVIQKFSGRGENMDDLLQVGCVGLIKAEDCFRPGKAIKGRDTTPEKYEKLPSRIVNER